MRYEILGDDMQMVVLSLNPGQAMMAEAGSMMYMTDSIDMETRLRGQKKDEGLLSGLASGFSRALSGQSFFVTTYTATGAPGTVAFTPPYPGKVMMLNLRETGPMICQRNSFLCSELDVEINVAFTKRFGAGLFGGEGFILEKLSGDGSVFIHSAGMVVSLDLEYGQSLRVDTGCLVAMTETVDYDIEMVKGIKSIFFGGEGMFFARLQGPGKVYLQSLPFSRMADRIIQASHLSAGGGRVEQSTGVAGIGADLLGGLFSGE